MKAPAVYFFHFSVQQFNVSSKKNTKKPYFKVKSAVKAPGIYP